MSTASMSLYSPLPCSPLPSGWVPSLSLPVPARADSGSLLPIFKRNVSNVQISPTPLNQPAGSSLSPPCVISPSLSLLTPTIVDQLTPVGVIGFDPELAQPVISESPTVAVDETPPQNANLLSLYKVGVLSLYNVEMDKAVENMSQRPVLKREGSKRKARVLSSNESEVNPALARPAQVEQPVVSSNQKSAKHDKVSKKPAPKHRDGHRAKVLTSSEKAAKRRAQNRASANTARLKKKAYLEELEARVAHLAAENASLKAQLKQKDVDPLPPTHTSISD